VSIDEINVGSYSSGAARVTSSHDDYFVCQFERDEWVEHFNEPESATIAGLSGGPAFVLRHSAAGVMSYEFSGAIYEFSEDYELLYVRASGAIPLDALR
jgi:hypothetical protein